MTTLLTLRDLVPAKAVNACLTAATKKDVLNKIAEAASALTGCDAHIIFDVLWERERLGTTGVGHCIAIPHGRVPGLDKVFGLFARLEQPVDFEAIDAKPVDLVFLLLAPEAAGADHLQALAMVSRMMRDVGLCEKIRKAKDGDAIYLLLTESVAASYAA